MILLCFICFLGLTFINYRIYRDFKNYATIFNLVWAITFLLLFIFKKKFYALHLESVVILISGGILFSIGFFAGKIVFKKTAIKSKYVESKKLDNNFLKICIVILTMLLPLYIYRCFNSCTFSSKQNIFYTIRVSMIKTDGNLFGAVWSNIILFSAIIALIEFNEYLKYKEGKILCLAAFFIMIIYNIFTGSTYLIIRIILTMIGCFFIRTKKVNKRLIITGFIFVFVVFAFMAFMLNKGQINNNNNSLVSNVDQMITVLLIYVLGGTVAFDYIVYSNINYISNGGVFRGIFGALKKIFDLKMEMPSLHLQFSPIGVNMRTNVYTMYGYYYLDMDFFRMSIIIILLGIFLYYIYIKALKKSDIVVIYYALFFSAVLLSGFSEFFIMDIIIYIKVFIVVFLYYKVIKV